MTTAAVLVGVALPQVAAAQSTWWNSAWGRRIKLTFNNSGQPENLLGFPVMVRLDSTRIDYTRTQNLGEDIRFVDADDQTVLAHQIELWNEAGSSYVWVRVPQVNASSTSDFIYLYFDNASAADGQNVNGVWDSGFQMVQHLNEPSPLNHTDSTSNGNDAVLINVLSQGTATGQIDGTDQFAGGEWIEVGDSGSLNMGSGDSFTVEAWVQTSATGWHIAVSKEDSTPRQYQLWVDDLGATSVAKFWLFSGPGVDAQAIGTSNVRNGQLHYLVGRWNEGSGQADIFVDGVNEDSDSEPSLGDISNANNLFIGKEGDGFGSDGEWQGLIDEVRISKVLRSDNWIKAQNLSMRDQFITFSPLEGESLCGGVAGQWWDARWGRRRKITFNNAAQVQDLVDFPVLVRVDSTRIDYARTQNNGQDIRFVEPGNNTVLAHQIEQWNEGGSSYVWVKVPRVNGASSSDYIWMYYDNGSTADGQNAAAVWSNGYESVYHLHADFADSTGTKPAGTNNGSTNVVGLAADGQQFDGIAQYIDTNWTSNYAASQDFTWEGWFRLVGVTNTDDIMGIEDRGLGAGCGGADCSEIRLGLRDQVVVDGEADSYDSWMQADSGGSFNASNVPLSNPDDGSWHYAVFLRNGGTARLYYDGGEVSSGAVSTAAATFPVTLLMGAQWDTDTGGAAKRNFFQGRLDEIRTSTVARSADWVRAQYRSVTDTFASYGPEVGQCHLRSIGVAADDAAGTVTANVGSRVVTGNLTAWKAQNRGRGDRITIDGTDYTVLWVESDTKLTLTSVFIGPTSGGGKAYVIARKFDTMVQWEDCIDGPGGAGCEGVSGASLVTDNRGEVGIAFADAPFTPGVPMDIDNGVAGGTDAVHNVTLTVDPPNRHNGVAGSGVVVDGQNAGSGVGRIGVFEDYTTVEWLEIMQVAGASAGGVRVFGAQNVLLQGLLLHANTYGVAFGGSAFASYTLRNSMIYNNVQDGIGNGTVAIPRITVQNCTIYGNGDSGIDDDSARIMGTVINTIVARNVTFDIDTSISCGGQPCFTQSYNLTGDPSAGGAGSKPGVGVSDNPATCTDPQGCVFFQSCPVQAGTDCTAGAGVYNLHLRSAAFTNQAGDAGWDLSSTFPVDIDGARRMVAWDMGADDFAAVTAVTLQSFEAGAQPAAVELWWETGSELHNLGFHLYRSLSAPGPYQRITSTVIPGLGSSPLGTTYRYLDSGLVNGVTYFYKLEDIETTGQTQMHGPVQATPQAGSAPAGPPAEAGESRTRYGDPDKNGLKVTRVSPGAVLLELVTEGFYTVLQEDGSVRIEVPGFAGLPGPGSPWVPTKRAWVEALAGRGVRLEGLRLSEVTAFTGLRPEAGGQPQLEVSEDGTAQAGTRRQPEGESFRRGLYPGQAARLVDVAFQGDVKKALVDLAPLRWDASSLQLLMAKRLSVRLIFAGVAGGETGQGGSRGRRYTNRESQPASVLARLVTRGRGLYGVRYEDLFPGQAPGEGRGLPTSNLLLSRGGETVPFHLEPTAGIFARGSVLYFVSEGASQNPFGTEAVYELELAPGTLMPVTDGTAHGATAGYYWKYEEWEKNLNYQSALLDARDLWLWEGLLSPVTKSYSFTVSRLAAGAGPSQLTVWLEGASDFEANPDHHVRARVNTGDWAEASWNGMWPGLIQVSIPAGVLQDGQNQLQVQNVGDTGASYSYVFLDKFSLSYPRQLEAEAGVLRGSFSQSGSAAVSGISTALVVDTTTEPTWVRASRAKFAAQAGRSYLVTEPSAVLRPEIRQPGGGGLRNLQNRADYLVIGPREFLEAAQPLLQRRESQGLVTKAVAVEDVYEEFGHGEASPQALKDFIAYAYHLWQAPAVKYVVLLGDGSYDFKGYVANGKPNRVMPLMVKTSYLWTASDPAYGAVNGEDALPDLAVGRLSASSLAEVQALVAKVLAFEDSGQDFGGKAVLVADNADEAGEFEANQEEIAGMLPGRPIERIYLRDYGTAAATRAAIINAFNDGPGLVSYVGHGSVAVWASENFFNNNDVNSLLPQAHQPLLMTMNCLNGFFLHPVVDSLSEVLVKAPNKGVIAAFSPTGLSVDAFAHLYQTALVQELESGQHERLGDAILAAQAAYADTGAMPELLEIYLLLGDPGLKLR